MMGLSIVTLADIHVQDFVFYIVSHELYLFAYNGIGSAYASWWIAPIPTACYTRHTSPDTGLWPNAVS